jgi:hypothetical protein
MSWSRACDDKFHTENVTNGAHSEMQTEQCSVSQLDEDTAATAMHLLPRIKVWKLMLMWNRVRVNHASSLPNSAVQTWALTLSRIRPQHQDPKITTSPRKRYSCQIAKEHIFVKRHSCHKKIGTAMVFNVQRIFKSLAYYLLWVPITRFQMTNSSAI